MIALELSSSLHTQVVLGDSIYIESLSSSERVPRYGVFQIVNVNKVVQSEFGDDLVRSSVVEVVHWVRKLGKNFPVSCLRDFVYAGT